jgi:hypothetical protein
MAYAAPLPFSSQNTMNQSDALTVLRSSVAQLEQDEKLALAAFLALESTVYVSYPAFQEKEGFREDLQKAFEATTKFSRGTKLAFAIELLQHQLSKAQEDKNDGSDDCEDYYLDPYDCDTPAIDEDDY